MRLTICDKCKREITYGGVEYKRDYSKIHIRIYSNEDEKTREYIQLCNRCTASLNSWLDKNEMPKL